ncbi:CW-type Zinc Finger isoform X2 [Wolffia australiana]
MLSVGSEIDGRRSVLGRRFRMEENELEEGEAISSLEYDAVVDPDVSLSYIDEKIQVVLGHFQKDFEGEISAESSGAKLGEYGSFLPVYMRLPPVCPQQSRVPARVADWNTSTSSQNPPAESKATSSSPPVPSGNVAAPPPQQLDDTKKNKIYSIELTPKNGVTINSNNSGNENKLLKLRIKVGSGNLLLGPLAAIYSDMGLDYSPSSSPEDSPGTSEGKSLGNSPSGSPMAAFQIMTCFPVPDGSFLSPLPESILRLVENQRIYLKNPKLGELNAFEGKGNLLERKKVKSMKDKTMSAEVPDSSQKEKQMSKPEALYDKSEKQMPDRVGNQSKNSFAEEKPSLHDLSDDELLDVVASPNTRRIDEIGAGCLDIKGKESLKTSSADKKLEDEKLNKQKIGLCIDDPNLQSDRSLRPHVSNFTEDGEMGLQELGTKRKPKQCEISQKESIDKKKIHSKGDISAKKQAVVKSQKTSIKSLSKETQKDLSLEPKAAKTGRKADPTESPFGERIKQSGAIDKSSDNPSMKKAEYPPPFNSTENRQEFSMTSNNPSFVDATSALHVVIEDNWVACDKCQQWRLLPYGMDPAQLPKKWLCTMMDWLPGMNKCSISEEETTRALHAAYHPPVIDNQVIFNESTRQVGFDAQPIDSQTEAGCQLPTNYEKKKGFLKEFPSKGTQPAEPVKQQRAASVESLIFRENQVNANGISRTSDPLFENTKEKRKKKHKYVEQCAAEDGLVSKSKSKRRSDQDDHWVSKKVKSVEACSVGEDGNSFRGKSASITSSGFHDGEDSGKKSRGVHEKVPLNGTSKYIMTSISKPEKEDSSVKKRKEKQLSSDYIGEKEEIRRGGPPKEKKVKISKMEEMGTLKIKRNDEIDPRDKGMKRPQKMTEITKKHITQEQYHGFSEPEQPCTAATSSSSKVSGSSKNKSSFHEMRGSPVDSVSSSPLKISNAGGSDAALSTLLESQRRRSYGEVFGGIDQSVNSDASRGKSVYKDKKSEFEENKTTAGDDLQRKNGSGLQKPSSSLSRSKEEPKTSKSSVEQYRDKSYDNLGSSHGKKNIRHDSVSDLRDSNLKTSEIKLPNESPRDMKLRKSETPEKLETNERELRFREKEVASDSSKMGKISPYVDKRATKPDYSPSLSKSSRDNGAAVTQIDGDKGKLLEQPKNLNPQNGKHQNYSAASVLKEARDLKHTANRLKTEGLEQQSTALYFEAALKFLHVAFLLELSSAESGKHGEAVAMYSDTAKLCEFCAYEYEKWKEMAAAALAYKCMEVAYLNVVYSKHPNASKDRHELQVALQMGLSGESPSSSASDIDNLNNQSTIIKGAASKVANPSQTLATHVIAARNRPTCMRLLDFTHDVNAAMEASRKSQNAFSAASACLEGSNYSPEGLASVKRVLDLSFHNVEGLLRLIRQSMDSISRWLHHS